MSGVQILTGDCRDILPTLEPESVQTCVTSPPYWGLRDYGTEQWEGGDAECDHLEDVQARFARRDGGRCQVGNFNGSSKTNLAARPYKEICSKCGARRIDSQLGLESTPEEYIDKMVAVFREVWRVLKADGTLWIVMGDSYATGAGSVGNCPGGGKQGENWQGRITSPNRMPIPGLKPKDLCMIPARLAMALQADGWYLRSDIIWQKPNPMPESVTDRPTKAHEYIFLLTKGQSRSRTITLFDCEPERIHFSRNLGAKNEYMGTSALCVELATAFFDVAQEQSDFSLPPFYSQEWQQRPNSSNGSMSSDLPPMHRAATYAARFLNSDTSTKEFLCEIYSLWRQLTEADHLLIASRLSESSRSPCAFVDSDGAIAVNDSRKVSKVNFVDGNIIVTTPTSCNYFYDAEAIREPAAYPEGPGNLVQQRIPGQRSGENANLVNGLYKVGPKEYRNKRSVWTITTQPYAEAHFATFPEEIPKLCILAGSKLGDTILDPFAGSGTTGRVALELGRRAILIELNPHYVELAQDRTFVTPGFL